MKNFLTAMLLILASAGVSAQVLTLDECRQLALQGNKKMEIDREAVAASADSKKAAMSLFFPQFSANGGYMYNSMDLHLIPGQIQVPIIGTITQGEGLLGKAYGAIYDKLTLDMHHTLAGQVGVVQPIFLGGKVIQAYKIARSAEHIAQMKQDYDQKDLTIKVDEAYWRVLNVQKKKALAQQYYDLLMKLTSDVEALVEEGVATRADLLKVTMKRHEAEEKLGQATDGLILSKMALCQLIGKELDFDIRVSDQGLEEFYLREVSGPGDDDVNGREEIQMLEEAENIARAGKWMAASTLMPNVVASANYIMTNKNFSDGMNFNKYYGWVNAGVVVNIPIAHASDIYKVKAAKHREKMASLAVEEMREMLELQATQSRQQVTAAQRKLIRTQSASENAREVLRMAQEGFDEGVISSTDLMAAQTQWQSAESDRIEAAIELKLAELTYRKNTGKSL